MTILLYLRRKGWPLRSVSVECSHERVDHGDGKERGPANEVIRQRVVLDGDFTDERRYRVALRCPVHRTLESGATQLINTPILRINGGDYRSTEIGTSSMPKYSCSTRSS